MAEKRYGLLCLKGMAMGAADVVPGVSGGTIALIVGVYSELLHSLRSCNHRAVLTLFKEGPAAFWRHINGTFLLVLGSGILLSIVSLARIITHLLDNYPILLWAFFFGLIIASIGFLSRQLESWSPLSVVAMLVGTGIAYGISTVSPMEGPKELWFVFVAGMIAICAMILPGISGSFLLLLMGMYTYVLQSIKSFDLLVIGTFAMGAGIGLLSFSHLLSWLLDHYKNTTMALLTGFLIGSLNVVWPWKIPLDTMINHHGETVVLSYSRVSPMTYGDMTGMEAYMAFGLLLMAIGAVLVIGLELFSTRQKTDELTAS